MIGARAGIRHVEGDVDHVGAAMERQHLHDLVAVGGDRLQLELQRSAPGASSRGPGNGS